MMLTGGVVDKQRNVLVGVIFGIFVRDTLSNTGHQQVINMIPYMRPWIDDPVMSVKDSSSIKYKCSI